jgi:hypothetical protein
LGELERDRQNLEEVLKNYLLKQQLNKYRIFGIDESSTQTYSLCNGFA